MGIYPLLWIRWEKLKEIKLKILAYSVFVNVLTVVTEFVYAIQLFSSISVNSSFYNIHLQASHIGEYSATIHLDFRK